MTITVPRELKSPNKWQGRHWRYKHMETQEWEKAIAVTYYAHRDCRPVLDLSGRAPLVRRQVTVVRQVPSLRNFIRDDDNLRFATKPLNDALKRLGFIHDDSRKWLEQTLPTQEVSNDGNYYTRITIEQTEPETGLKAIGAVR